jgi:hypothetical protein
MYKHGREWNTGNVQDSRLQCHQEDRRLGKQHKIGYSSDVGSCHRLVPASHITVTLVGWNTCNQSHTLRTTCSVADNVLMRVLMAVAFLTQKKDEAQTARGILDLGRHMHILAANRSFETSVTSTNSSFLNLCTCSP